MHSLSNIDDTASIQYQAQQFCLHKMMTIIIIIIINLGFNLVLCHKFTQSVCLSVTVLSTFVLHCGHTNHFLTVYYNYCCHA